MLVKYLRVSIVVGFLLLGLLNVSFLIKYMNNNSEMEQQLAKRELIISKLNEIRTLVAISNDHQIFDPKLNQVIIKLPNFTCLRDCGASKLNQIDATICKKCSHCGPVCRDKQSSRQCEQWADKGECETNPNFMLTTCAASCKACGVPRVTQSNQLSYFVELSNGLLMPRIGLGTAALGEATFQAVTNALSVGYQMIDTAEAKEWYRQDLVGSAIKNSSNHRHEIFITSKLHPRDFGYQNTLQKIQSTLKELQIQYLDQFLLHYAHCFSGLIGCEKNSNLNQQDRNQLLLETWRALEKSYNDGKILSIGVSNFDISEIEFLFEFAEIKPMILQRNSDPFSQDIQIRKFCAKKDIQYVAYSSLGTQHQMRRKNGENPVLNNQILKNLGEEIGNRGVVEVILRWGLQEGQVVIPRTRNIEHMKQNLNVLENFYLSGEQLNLVDCLDGMKE